MSSVTKQTEETTSLYTATVQEVYISGAGNRAYTEIRVKEYDTLLYISANLCKSIEIVDIKELKEGDIIFFRIEDIKVEHLDNAEFVDIVSLKTEEKNILTLEDYNEYMYNAALPARITSVIMALVFLFISVLCCLKLYNNLKLKKSQK